MTIEIQNILNSYFKFRPSSESDNSIFIRSFVTFAWGKLVEELVSSDIEPLFVQVMIFGIFLEWFFSKNIGSMRTSFGIRHAGVPTFKSSGEFFCVYRSAVIGVKFVEHWVGLCHSRTTLDSDRFLDLNGWNGRDESDASEFHGRVVCCLFFIFIDYNKI